MFDAQTTQRFWSKVARGGGGACWEWQASVRERGYGQFRRGDKCLRAHRVAWETSNGPIPDGLCVLHTCDNRKCCNPSHLFLGTPADNTTDMLSKGRARGGAPKGTRNGARLTGDQVQMIRAAFGTHAAIAAQFSISRSQVGMIRSGKRWVEDRH